MYHDDRQTAGGDRSNWPSKFVNTYVIASLIQDASNTLLLHNDIARMFPLDKAYPTFSCPRHHLKMPNIRVSRYRP